MATRNSSFVQAIRDEGIHENQAHHRQETFLNVNAQYVHFLRHVPSLLDLSKFDVSDDEWQKGVENTIDQIKKRSLPMTDVSCFLYLYDRITGKKGDIRMRHVFIDEIQDYTAYQLAYLKTEFPRARFTMLGDLNQAIFTKTATACCLSFRRCLTRTGPTWFS